MNIIRSRRGFSAVLLITIIVTALTGCSMKIVPTQYDLALSSKTKSIEVVRGGDIGEIEVLLNSSRYDDLSTAKDNTFLSYHYFTGNGELVEYDGIRTELEPVPARGKKNEVMAFIAPLEAGEYVLQVDLVQEGVTWFSREGMPALDIPLTVLETGDYPL